MLHSVAQTYKEKLEMKAYNHKKQEEIDELSKCTFKPVVHSYYPPGEDFYEGVPRGFKVYFSEFKVANFIKENC